MVKKFIYYSILWCGRIIILYELIIIMILMIIIMIIIV